MRRIIGRSVLPVLTLFALTTGDASAGPMTYNIVNLPDYQGGTTVMGTITTDGTIGDVSEHITAWSVDILIQSTSVRFFSSAGLSTMQVNGLIASATELYLPPPNNIAPNLVVLNGFNPLDSRLNGSIGWIVDNGPGGPLTTYEILTSENTGPFISHPPVLNPNWVIASVPEPSTLTLLGIAAVCLAAYYRRVA